MFLLQASSSEQAAPEAGQLPALEDPECGNHMVGGFLDLDSEFERRLAVGAQLACQLRTAVKQKLGTQHVFWLVLFITTVSVDRTPFIMMPRW